jgi:hypothetical protein
MFILEHGKLVRREPLELNQLVAAAPIGCSAATARRNGSAGQLALERNEVG